MTQVVTPVTNRSLSWFVNKVVPSYIIEQYSGLAGEPSLPLFLQKFFEFLGQNYIDTEVDSQGNTTQTVTAQGAYLIIQNLISYADIDQTLTGFLQYFKKEYADSFPFIGNFDDPANSISTDLRRLIKHIRDFYLSKGSTNSLRFFFRAGFDQEIELYFPSVDMLRVSAGTWFEPFYLGGLQLNGTALTTDQLNGLLDKSLVGQTSNATGYVQAIDSLSIPNGVVNTSKQNWISLATHKGSFQDGEHVNAYDSITGALTFTFKLKDRGYSTLDNTFPPQPYSYIGLWKNDVDYKIGDVVYVNSSVITSNHSLENKFYVAVTPLTSISYPGWVGNSFYRPASIVVYSGSVYQVKSNRTTLKSTVNPQADTDNWEPLGIVATAGSPVWSSGTTYNNGDQVYYTGVDSIVRKYRLMQFRTQFKSTANPASDTTNWVLLAGETASDYTSIPPGTQYTWSASNEYYEASTVLDANGQVYRAKQFRSRYSSPIPPSDPAVVNIVWQRISSESGSDSPTHPDWSAVAFYDFGDVVNYEDATLGWGLYKLIKPLEPQFLSNIAPSMDTFRWSLIDDGNYNFDDEYNYAAKWTALPSGVNPENIGQSTGDFPGHWLDHSGWLDSEKKIQDSFFYQDFSYQVSIDLDKTAFQEALFNTAHPAGFQLFNVVTSVDLLTPYSLELQLYQPDINFIVQSWGWNIPFDFSYNGWYQNNDVVFYNTIDHPETFWKATSVDPFNADNDPPLDGSHWTDVTSTYTFGHIFKPLASVSMINLVTPFVPVISTEIDFSTFEANRCFIYTNEQDVVDYLPMNIFEIMAGSNNVLAFVNGRKIPGQQKRAYTLPGQTRYLT